MNKKEQLLKIEKRFIEAGIKYYSEPVLRCRQLDRVIGPDFCVFNKVTGEKFVWLHFIDMSNKEYLDNVFWPKFREYNQLGFVMGINMIVTCEKEEDPITDEEIDDFIYRFLLTESKDERSVMTMASLGLG